MGGIVKVCHIVWFDVRMVWPGLISVVSTMLLWGSMLQWIKGMCSNNTGDAKIEGGGIK